MSRPSSGSGEAEEPSDPAENELDVVLWEDKIKLGIEAYLANQSIEGVRVLRAEALEVSK